ncbi:NAD(P)-dependent oxidoreductase [Leptospira sp. 85282-16]|uniref:NAD(P)-dependent oxidoreductase n=1 Tax=Leptospira montravelensis TaxID=2484961 RepID=A0ABY2LRV8_9LEPT|nr:MULTISPECIES: NAD(P)-dependent oxidoreductase [Leptospira]MCT8333995.1 NAD(P)-dependent oxidoreductase [Leptospira sp. 85282-16]TGK80385.1 NAD(P)-dependent oxidoreductase [Leptospira montravelensis]TGL00561.1 NAD(P)-dependent oxidoreductase [Leptospira montravelensis]
MKITLIGATGFIGNKTLEETLNRGYQVTTVLRDPSKLKTEHKNLTKVKGDIFDTDGLSKIISGSDAVLDSYNPGWTDLNIRENMINGSLSILGATKKAGVKRIIVMGGAGSLEVQPGVQLIDTPEFPKEYFGGADGARQILNHLRSENDLEWTFLSPSAVIEPEGPKTGKYRFSKESLLVDTNGHSHISLADLVKAFVDELEERKYVKQRFTVGY